MPAQFQQRICSRKQVGQSNGSVSLIHVFRDHVDPSHSPAVEFRSRWTFGEHAIYIKLLDSDTGFTTRTVDTVTVFIEIFLEPAASSQHPEAGTMYAGYRIRWRKLLTYGPLPRLHLAGLDLLAHPNQYRRTNRRLLLPPD
jgi:hypothetical protein